MKTARDFRKPFISKVTRLATKYLHGVWKSQKKLYLTLRAKRAYVDILNGQKFVKNAKNCQFGEFLKTWSLWSNSVTRHRTKISGKYQNWKIQMRHFWVIFKHCGCSSWSYCQDFCYEITGKFSWKAKSRKPQRSSHKLKKLLSDDTQASENVSENQAFLMTWQEYHEWE